MTKEFHFPLYNHLDNIRFSLHCSSDFRVLDSLLPSYVQYTSIAFHLERQQSFLIGFSEGSGAFLVFHKVVLMRY